MKNIQNWENFNEGKTEKASKTGNKRTEIKEDKKDLMRKSVKDHVKSQECDTKKVGDDFEIHLDKKHIGQVIFRDNIKVKKVNNDKIGKFGFEGQYSDKSDFAKIKKEIKKIVDENK